MSKVSKTARASAGMVVREVKVIPNEVYIKNLRIDLESGLYVAQEGARALLRAYDTAIANSVEQVLATNSEREQRLALEKSNLALDAELKAALSQIETLTQDLEISARNAAELKERIRDLELAAEEAAYDEYSNDETTKKEGDFIG